MAKGLTPVDFFVHIIESPSPDDFLLKRTEGQILVHMLQLMNIPCGYFIAVNDEMFKKAVYEGLPAALESDSSIPIIHISANGNADGIALTNGDIINWYDLTKILNPINNEYDNLLILCMSSCRGYAGCKMAITNDDVPFFAIIGHRDNPEWSDTALGFCTFYKNLSKGHSISDSVNAMRASVSDDRFSCEFGDDIKQGWLEYLHKKKKEKLQMATQNLIKKARRQGIIK